MICYVSDADSPGTTEPAGSPRKKAKTTHARNGRKNSPRKKSPRKNNYSPRKRQRKSLPAADPEALTDLVALLGGKKVRKDFEIYIEYNATENSIGLMDGWMDG
jgi:hypothetical protein